jgi:Xaa-Pro dipeptidase
MKREVPKTMLRNVDRLLKRATQQNFNAYVASSPQNVLYLSDFWSPGGFVGTEPSFAVLAADSSTHPVVVCPMGPMDVIADEDLQLQDVVTYGRFYTHIPAHLESRALSPADVRLRNRLSPDRTARTKTDRIGALVAALEAMGLAQAALAVDETGFSPVEFGHFREAMPNAEIRAGYEELRWVRMVKTAEEISRLREAARITCRAIESAIGAAREGVSEHELGVAFSTALAEEGATTASLAIGFGYRTAHPNSNPGPQTLKPGELIRFDVGCRYRSYHTDLARIACLGEPSQKAKKYHSCILAGQAAALEILRSGVRASRLFERAMEATRREGLRHYERHNVGHGIGLEFYDPPFLTADNNLQLEKNMVLCVETPYYELGFGGVQVEDMVLVTDTGFEFLSDLKREIAVT